jgi:hypothetical protein
MLIALVESTRVESQMNGRMIWTTLGFGYSCLKSTVVWIGVKHYREGSDEIFTSRGLDLHMLTMIQYDIG